VKEKSGGGIVEQQLWARHHEQGVVVRWRNPIMAEQPWRRNHRNPEEGGSGIVNEAFGVHLDASVGHLADIWHLHEISVYQGLFVFPLTTIHPLFTSSVSDIVYNKQSKDRFAS